MTEAAVETVDRKSSYHGDRDELGSIPTEGIDTFQRFAHPPVDDDTLRGSLWRTYGRGKGSIRIAFTQADLRTSAGCAPLRAGHPARRPRLRGRLASRSPPPAIPRLRFPSVDQYVVLVNLYPSGR